MGGSVMELTLSFWKLWILQGMMGSLFQEWSTRTHTIGTSLTTQEKDMATTN